MSENDTYRTKGTKPYWVLRALETALLLTALVSMGLFAWSLVDIIRIETSPALAAAGPLALPAGAWPGIFGFFASMIALQIVRTFLHRYRRDDGMPRGDESAAAAATAEVLAGTMAASGPSAVPVNDASDA